MALNRRQTLAMLGGLGAAGTLAACSGDSATTGDSSPMRIGLLAPQTGALRAVGTEMVNGFQQFLAEHDGLLAGRPVEIRQVDEGDSTESGLLALRQLFTAGVVAIVGVANSALLDTAQEEIEKARIPVLAASGIPEKVQGASYLWSTSYAEHEPGVAIGPYLRQFVSKKGDVAVVAPRTASGEDAVNGFRFAFGPKDRRLAATIWTKPTLNGELGIFDEAVRRIAQTKASAVFCYYAGAAAITFVRQLREAGSTAQLYGPGLLTDGSVLAELGPAAAGIRTALNYSADLDNAVNHRFASAYRRAHGQSPTAAAVGAYDAGAVIDKALRSVRTRATAEDLYFGLDRVGQIGSPRGVWQFNQVRTPLQRWYLREVRKDGPVLANVTLNELATLG